MKYLLFGTGDYYERYKKWFDKDDVVALIDNSDEKNGKYIDGHIVLKPDEAVKLNFDAIVILSFYYIEMRDQLIEIGIDKSKIYHFYDIRKILPCDMGKHEIHYWEAPVGKKVRDKKILLLSHDLSLGGPALALYHMARILKKNGYGVVFGSMQDGPLRQMLIVKEISVVVDENIQREGIEETAWVSGFDLVVCNTINFQPYLSRRNATIPVIWWLHDSEFFYGGVDREGLEKMEMRGLYMVSVGPVPKKAMHSCLPEAEIGELLYGVAM